ncbi:energy-coupling factor transport system permease protein [Anaerospora hongkongensis]|uniref:Energy-coupling factor transport system permease protein n=1 Tax=Anaerospora hongkongensis TaxID=244830 RepID=A0A4R1PU33_9FIRM|nr:energy-coupling factor transporter transmembrane component T [Anaerospora hongkongensis]TCL35413.1 energy-coupling factor transport system permease protein [Anaerospora hongkongensis]
MNKAAPLTKLILTLAVSIWSLLLYTVSGLVLLVLGQLALIVLAGALAKTARALLALSVFAAALAGLQYLLGSGIELSLVTGLRMISMTEVFLLLLATTRMQDLTAALVSQCRVPYEYAFMFTAALRFVPDFIAESRAVQEAQACRGYSAKGSIIRRLTSYLAIVEPLVLRAVSRSETMAMSLALRGFGGTARSFTANVSLGSRDYAMLAVMVLVTAGLVIVR